MYSKNELRMLLTFSEKVAKKAGLILLKEQKKVKIVEQKDLQDIATTADILSEKFIINSIQKKYPEHGIFSEEKGEIKKESNYRWVIDPLDGTKEFIRGIPLFNVSIILQIEGETVVACVYRPTEDTLYCAAKGLGSFRDGKRIKVSSVKSLNEAFVYCYLPSFHRQKERYDWAFKILGDIGKQVYRLRALSDENTALCWLAQGGIEGYLNLSNPPKWHDVAPGLLIAKEAGSVITDANENKIHSENVASLVVANNKEIHTSLIKQIKSND